MRACESKSEELYRSFTKPLPTSKSWWNSRLFRCTESNQEQPQHHDAKRARGYSDPGDMRSCRTTSTISTRLQNKGRRKSEDLSDGEITTLEHLLNEIKKTGFHEAMSRTSESLKQDVDAMREVHKKYPIEIICYLSIEIKISISHTSSMVIFPPLPEKA